MLYYFQVKLTQYREQHTELDYITPVVGVVYEMC